MTAAEPTDSVPLGMTTSGDRRRLSDELLRLESEAKALVGSVSPEQLNWQPDGGRSWSVAQCVDHLTRSNAIYLPALAMAAAGAPQSGSGGLRPNLLGRWFVRWLEPPAKLKAKAPLDAMQPSAHHEAPALLEAFSAGQRAVIEFLRQTEGRDLDAVRFENPMVGGRRLFNVSTGLLVIAAHERRHLWQARRVLQRQEFPR